MVKPLNLVVAASLGLALSAVATASSQPIVVLPLTGAIGPASADFVERGLVRADHDDAQLLVLQIDTPGGLDTSMRDIIKAILSSRVPVAAFVAPSGARAASAGTYILYASHVAAMAPGTNLGAASPVQIGVPDPVAPGRSNPGDAKDKGNKTGAGDDGAGSSGVLAKKQMHDAAAYIRGLAQMRGRNPEWAERAVRDAVSLPAEEALAQHVIDLTARDVPDLLQKLDGRKLTTAAGERTLATAGANIVAVTPDWKTRFLAVITDPGVALILMMIGMYGLFFEFSNPGFVLPGVVGAMALVIGLFALHMLPVNYAGLALILLGMAFIVAEAFVPSYGTLSIGGIAAFVLGAVLLIDTDVPGFGISIGLIATLAGITALFVLGVSGVALKARRRPIVTGREELIGSVGVVLGNAATEGWARIHSEQWRIRSAVPLAEGQRVRVTACNGLELTVTPLPETGEGS